MMMNVLQVAQIPANNSIETGLFQASKDTLFY
jgi:hypothetical protein